MYSTNLKFKCYSLILKITKKVVFVILFCFSIVFSSQSMTFIVNSTVDEVDVDIGDGLCQTINNHCSLRAAIMETNAAVGADEINLLPGHYQLSISGAKEDQSITGDLDITDQLTIIGAGVDKTIIDGGQLDRIFDIHFNSLNNVNISLLTITQGLINANGPNDNGPGGAIKVSKFTILDLNQVSFVNNNGGTGGALFSEGKINAEKVLFIGNHATGKGGAVAIVGSGSQLNIKECLFENNSASTAGVLLMQAFSDSKKRVIASLNKCAIINNNAINTIILNDSFSEVTIRNSTLSANSGDGVLFNDGESFFTISNSSITHNNGAGIIDVHNNDSFVRISNSLLAGNLDDDNLADNCRFKLTSLGGNYFGDLTGCDPTLHLSDILGVEDAEITPLTRFENPWQIVHLPLIGSPLLDSGLDEACEDEDQLGEIRLQDSDFDGKPHCNIGATAVDVSVLDDVIFGHNFE